MRGLPTLETGFSRGMLRIRHRHNLNMRIASSAISEWFQVHLSFNSILSYPDAMDFASDFQDLLTIATHRTAAFEKVELTHPDFKESYGEGQFAPRSARLWANWLPQPKPSKHTLSDDDMTFTFNQLGDIDGVGKWMTAAEQYRTQLSRVMNTRYNEHMFQQDIHLGRIAALESFHKEWPAGTKPKKPRERIHLKMRLDELVNLANAPFEVLIPQKKRDMWIKRIVDERDDVAHHLGRELHQDTNELYNLSESAYWLFVMCLLRVADVPEACFTHMTQHRHFRWCARELYGLLT